MKIAVLGASGRTGQEFLRVALEAKHQVVAIVRSPEKVEIQHDDLEVSQLWWLIQFLISIKIKCILKVDLATGLDYFVIINSRFDIPNSFDPTYIHDYYLTEFYYVISQDILPVY